MWFISINRLLKILLNNVRNQYENFFFHVKPKVVTFPLLVSLFFFFFFLRSHLEIVLLINRVCFSSMCIHGQERALDCGFSCL